jgi:hypothetical protein
MRFNPENNLQNDNESDIGSPEHEKRISNSPEPMSMDRLKNMGHGSWYRSECGKRQTIGSPYTYWPHF